MVDNQKEAESLYKQMIRAAKQATKYVDYTNLDFIQGKYVVTIETNIPEGIGDLCELLIDSHKRATLVETECFAGSFDWASDTYIKDQVLIWFKF